MRVLVTGAGGFVGRHVLHCLEQRGADVFALSRKPRTASGAEHWLVLERPQDGGAVAACVQRVAPDVIVHLAGVSSAPDPQALYDANVVFAANLLDAAWALPRPARVLVAGSAAEYGAVPEALQPVQEDTPCRPDTAYGVSKLAQTGHALLARSRGLPVCVARVFNPVGAGMPATLALGSFAEQIAAMGPQGGVLNTGDLDAVRDFMDVRHTAALLVDLATDHAGTVDIVNVCSGQGHNLQALTQRLAQIAGIPVTVRRDPARHGNSNVRAFVGHPGRLRSLGLSPGAGDMDEVLAAVLASARERHAASQHPTGTALRSTAP